MVSLPSESSQSTSWRICRRLRQADIAAAGRWLIDVDMRSCKGRWTRRRRRAKRRPLRIRIAVERSLTSGTSLLVLPQPVVIAEQGLDRQGWHPVCES